MNILPKKRWHVRTKENIARVRRDEAAAAAELKEAERRVKLAEQEARTSLLRNQARARIGRDCPDYLEAQPVSEVEASTSTAKHVNFFEDLESGETTAAGNEEHEAEKRQEKEEYEKKIGLLTYLGQDSHELTGDKSWWQKIPLDRDKAGENLVEVTESAKSKSSVFQKDLLDPLTTLRKYLGCDGVKRVVKKSEAEEKRKRKKRKRSSSSDSSDNDRRRKKRKKKDSRRHDVKKKKQKKDRKKKSKKRAKSSESDSSIDEESLKREAEEKAEKQAQIEKLRIERMAREQQERQRTERLLYGEPEVKRTEKTVEEKIAESRKYNNQFNPEVARQNKLDSSKKYWLE